MKDHTQSSGHPPGRDPLTRFLVDAAQRTILYWDTMRRRGNQYHRHMARKAPNVLDYDFELLIDGRSLPEPVNYGLVKIHPPEGTTVDETRRPFVVVDPRAGHGPGIGGFKADSEIGVIMAEGHPCYFIGFSPHPEPGQTIETVMRAMAAFLEHIIGLHPDADEKPVVIGNCQAGWAVMMMAAVYPELCGPIIAAGSPLSYWAGVHGKNPMRYSGGMLGGSWLTALTSDMGNGIFDGSWLVVNFENLNPANTLWTKQYNLYSRIDTEVPRYLGFERWWTGHVLLNGEEIQYIVDNLFVGNRLSTAEIITSDNKRVDLRNIRSPIICFCSWGDNITPPQQALDWILDLYDSVEDIRIAGQTIIYAIHDQIGHLGIFVSGGVARKEHSEFASNIDLIDCLPPGLYEAVIEKVSDATLNEDLVSGDYISRFEERTLDDIRALGGNDLEDERCFAGAARLSETTLGLYRTMLQPLVRAMANNTTAEWLRRLHPLRMSYDMFSDRNPLMSLLPPAARWVRENRRPVEPDNPFLKWQEAFSDLAIKSLDAYRDWRDMMTEQAFFAFYGQPWFQALMGLRATDDPPRRHPGKDPLHLEHVARRKEELLKRIEEGGPREAMLRGMMYVNMPEKVVDEREFEVIRRFRAQHSDRLSLSKFKEVLRDQYYMLLLDQRRAIAAIPRLLIGHEEEGPRMLDMIHRINTADGPLAPEGERRFKEIEKLFMSGKRTARKKVGSRARTPR